MTQVAATGIEWVIDAHGCSPQRLRDERALEQVFQALVNELGLKPLGDARFHTFPPPGGVTGLLMLTESHLTCHTFPETGTCALNLYCCRPRAEWNWEARLKELLGATHVLVRTLARPGTEV